MKREDIEKAAKDYSIGKTYFRRNVLKEVDADDYVLRKGNCSEDFIAGAEWRINSVWHDMKEKPNFKMLPILLKHKSGTIHFVDETPAHWEYMMKYYTRWAYIEDLIPNEQQKP